MKTEMIEQHKRLNENDWQIVQPEFSRMMKAAAGLDDIEQQKETKGKNWVNQCHCTRPGRPGFEKSTYNEPITRTG